MSTDPTGQTAIDPAVVLKRFVRTSGAASLATVSHERRPGASCAAQFPRARTASELPSPAVRVIVLRGSSSTVQSSPVQIFHFDTPIIVRGNFEEHRMFPARTDQRPASDPHRFRPRQVSQIVPVVCTDINMTWTLHFQSFFSEQPYWGRSFICPQYCIYAYVMRGKNLTIIAPVRADWHDICAYVSPNDRGQACRPGPSNLKQTGESASPAPTGYADS